MSRRFLRRVGAYVADCVLLFLVLAPAGVAAMWLLGIDPSTLTSVEVYFTALLTFSIPVWIYFARADASKCGATIGKRVLGLRVVSADGHRLSVRRAVGRTAVKLAPWELVHAAFFLVPVLEVAVAVMWSVVGTAYALIGAYLVVAGKTDGRRSVHDLIAQTSVVHRAGYRFGLA